MTEGKLLKCGGEVFQFGSQYEVLGTIYYCPIAGSVCTAIVTDDGSPAFVLAIAGMQIKNFEASACKEASFSDRHFYELTRTV